MIEIKDAVCAHLMADAALVAMLGAPAISGQWPAEAAAYVDVPVGSMDYATLPATSIDKPRGRITIVSISPQEDPELPIHPDDYQVDVWSMSERLTAAVSRSVKILLDRQGLLPERLRVTETYCTYGPQFYEATTRVHHYVLNYHVTWIGSA